MQFLIEEAAGTALELLEAELQTATAEEPEEETPSDRHARLIRELKAEA